ncbi:Maintenance of telomere capping protein 1 [Cladobotryum mycophilum]|uniref:Maintenance of telomere capping protein 1 n=1 Tax=Cladobotryum mycophilum TaxID=491253 RepID=A0ABR0SLK0_9HYPO
MASKKTKAAPADDSLDDLFSGIGDDSKAKKLSKPKPTSAAAKAIGDNDILADLESELAPQPSSRPHTPRLKEAAARRSTATPPAGDDKAASGAARKSTDSSRSHRVSFTPSAASPDPQERATEQPQQTGGGWWGGILSTANAAMKQAEAAYIQIQQNEEAKKWADQVKGLGTSIDVGALKSYGDELRSRALPTFTNILHTLAPPISSHEHLLIHISHDLVGYPSLDPLIHGVFSRVMSQVEGGDLLVVQRGHESGSRRSELGLVKGIVEGTKLCRANADAYSAEYFAANGGVEEAKTRAKEDMSETNPVRTSDLFLSVQAISIDQDNALFARTASAEKEKSASEDEADELICFAVFILDPVHGIEFSTISQTMPARWAHWLDAPSPLTPQSGDDSQEASTSVIPDEIRDIIESGGVDPREWVAEWIEEALNLAVGVVAQRYVAKRMGVGERMLGRGTRLRQDVLLQENAGEAARAGLI